MQAKYRLKKNYQYNYVYKHASTVTDRNIVVLYCNSNSVVTKVGFSVGKRQGNAVKRNRLRRQLKSAVSSIMPNVVNNRSIVIVPRKTTEYKYADIMSSLNNLFKKAGLLR